MMMGIRGSHGLGFSYGALRTCREWPLQGRDGMVLEGVIWDPLGSLSQRHAKARLSLVQTEISLVRVLGIQSLRLMMRTINPKPTCLYPQRWKACLISPSFFKAPSKFSRTIKGVCAERRKVNSLNHALAAGWPKPRHPFRADKDLHGSERMTTDHGPGCHQLVLPTLVLYTTWVSYENKPCLPSPLISPILLPQI